MVCVVTGFRIVVTEVAGHSWIWILVQRRKCNRVSLAMTSRLMEVHCSSSSCRLCPPRRRTCYHFHS